MAVQGKQTVVVSGLKDAALKVTNSPAKPTKAVGIALVSVDDGAPAKSVSNTQVAPPNSLPSAAEYEEINREITRQVRTQESFELSDGDDPMLAEWGRVLMGLAMVLGLLYGLKFVLLQWRASRPKQKRIRRLPPAAPLQQQVPQPQARTRRQKTIPTTPPSLSWQEVVQMIAEQQSPDEDTAPSSGTNPVGLTRLRRPRS